MEIQETRSFRLTGVVVLPEDVAGLDDLEGWLNDSPENWEALRSMSQETRETQEPRFVVKEFHRFRNPDDGDVLGRRHSAWLRGAEYRVPAGERSEEDLTDLKTAADFYGQLAPAPKELVRVLSGAPGVAFGPVSLKGRSDALRTAGMVSGAVLGVEEAARRIGVDSPVVWWPRSAPEAVVLAMQQELALVFHFVINHHDI